MHLDGAACTLITRRMRIGCQGPLSIPAFCTLNAIVTDIYELARAPTLFRPRVYTLPHTMAGIETIKVRVGGV